MAERDVKLTTGPAAREAECSEALIRKAAADGRLPSERTVGGIRVFTIKAVRLFAEQIKARRSR
jgi:hypothetical protein